MLLHKQSPVDFRKVRRSSEDILPDFSKRPDKFTYKEWEAKPELIPKGTTYYEVSNPLSGNHDNSNPDSDTYSHDSDRGRKVERRDKRSNGGDVLGDNQRWSRSPSNTPQRHSNGFSSEKKETERNGKGWKSRSPSRNGATNHKSWSRSPASRLSSTSPTPPPKGVKSKLVKPETARQKSSDLARVRSPSLRSRGNTSKDRSQSPSHKKSSGNRVSKSRSRQTSKHGSACPSEERLKITVSRSRSHSWSRYDRSSRSASDNRSRNDRELSRHDLESSRRDLESRDAVGRQPARSFSPIVWQDNRTRGYHDHRHRDHHPDVRERDYKDYDYRLGHEHTDRRVVGEEQYYRESRRERRRDRNDRERSPMRFHSKHDNREDFDYWSRGRGRGRGRGRVAYRGRGRGRSYSSTEPPWLHDKYQDEEPSSTTK